MPVASRKNEAAIAQRLDDLLVLKSANDSMFKAFTAIAAAEPDPAVKGVWAKRCSTINENNQLIQHTLARVEKGDPKA